jgi:hypothetical protein
MASSADQKVVMKWMWIIFYITKVIFHYSHLDPPFMGTRAICQESALFVHICTKINSIFTQTKMENFPGIFVQKKDPEQDPNKDPYLWIVVTREHPVKNTLKKRV